MAKILFCLLVYLKSYACSPPSYNKSHFYQKFENMRSSYVEQCKVLARVKDAVPRRYWKTNGDKKTIVPSYRAQYQFSPPSSIWMPCIICQQLDFILEARVSYGDPEFFTKNLNYLRSQFTNFAMEKNLHVSYSPLWLTVEDFVVIIRIVTARPQNQISFA